MRPSKVIFPKISIKNDNFLLFIRLPFFIILCFDNIFLLSEKTNQMAWQGRCVFNWDFLFWKLITHFEGTTTFVIHDLCFFFSKTYLVNGKKSRGVKTLPSWHYPRDPRRCVALSYSLLCLVPLYKRKFTWCKNRTLLFLRTHRINFVLCFKKMSIFY